MATASELQSQLTHILDTSDSFPLKVFTVSELWLKVEEGQSVERVYTFVPNVKKLGESDSDECYVDAGNHWEEIVADRFVGEERYQGAQDVVKHGAALFRHAPSSRQSFAGGVA
ncbi:MAG TPA: hypothetical protein PLN52_24410 [Opitutaceae bacterium]|nr:hypothetical protein [Opitutaceae bacterium]